MIKNIGLINIMNSTSESFVTETGLKIRKKAFKILQGPLKLATKKAMILENYPSLEPNEPYIFASTHSFSEDINVALANLDRNAFLLLGSTNQVEYNRGVYCAWLNGLVYVNRLDPKSRKESMQKMIRLLNSGTSVLIFPEGQYNNTPNLLCQKLFASPYTLNQTTGAKVVPVSSYTLPELDTIYINYGNPINFNNMTKKEALTYLRDILATMQYEQIEKYGGVLSRASLEGKDFLLEFLEQRMQEYLKERWTKDVWDEEIFDFIDKDVTEAKTVRESLANVAITKNNAQLIAPVLTKRLEDQKYDFKTYIKTNWRRR